MNSTAEFFKPFDIVICISPYYPVDSRTKVFVYGGAFHNDHGQASPGHKPVMSQQKLADLSSGTSISRIQRSHDYPVFQCLSANLYCF